MKRTSKPLLAALFSLLCALPLSAQIDPTVEVSREYDVKLQSIDKPFIGTQVPDSLRDFHVNMNYYTVDKPYADLYDFSPHRTFLLADAPKQRAPFIYAKLFGALPYSAEGGLYLQTPVRNGLSLSAFADHASYWPKGDTLAYDMRRTGFMKNAAGLKARYEWSRGVASLDAHYSGDVYRYWDTLFTKSVSSRYGVTLNVHSNDYASIRPFYDVTASYNYMKGGIDSDSLYTGKFYEHTIDVKATGGGVFRNNRILLEFETHDRISDYNAGFFSITPYYQYLNNLVDIRAGFRIASKTVSQTDGRIYSSRVKNFFPMLEFRVNVVPKLLWLNASVDGDNYLNSYTEMRGAFPWISASPFLNYSCDSYRAKVEMQLSIRDRLAVSAFVGYGASKNMPFLLPVDSLHVMDLEYADATHVTAGADAAWNSKDVTATAYYRFNKCTRDDGGVASLVPANEAGGAVRYNYRQRIFAKASFDYRSPVAFGASVIDSCYDLSLTAGYVSDRYFTFFLKAGNLLGKKNGYVPWSIAQPRNFGFGISFKF